MWKIILVGVLLLIALVLFIWRKYSWTESDYRGERTNTVKLWKFGFIPFGLAVLLILFTSFTQVHSKQVGVEVAFGKPVGEYGAGLHFKPFWASVTKVNETVYTDTYSGDKALTVRLGDGNPATVNTTIRWHINPAAVDYIYQTYGRSGDPTDALRSAVVDTQYGAVVNNVFSQFNPTSVIQNVNLKDPLQASRALNFSPDYTKMASDISAQMLTAVKDADGTPLVTIDGITVSGISYSQATESRIDGLVQQAAKTQQAVQLEATNQALADANGKLSNSLSGDDGVKVLVQQCLNDLADGKFTPPAGFSCWPGAGSSVVLPSASK